MRPGGGRSPWLIFFGVLGLVAAGLAVVAFILSLQQKNAPAPSTDLTLGGGGGDLHGTTDVPLLNVVNNNPGTWPNAANCVPVVNYLPDGRALVVNPCQILRATGGTVTGPLDNLTIGATGWPPGLACPNASYAITNAVTTDDGRIAFFECSLVNVPLRGPFARVLLVSRARPRFSMERPHVGPT